MDDIDQSPAHFPSAASIGLCTPSQTAQRHETVLSRHGSAAFQMQPFTHLLSKPCLADEHYETLAATFPALPLFRPDADRLDNVVLRIASSRVLMEKAFSGEWKSFVAHHTSQAFWRQMTRVFADHLRSLHPDLERTLDRPVEDWRAVRRGSGELGDVTLECQLVVNTPVLARASAVKAQHVDHVNKLWTGLLYMRDPADDSCGGDLQLYDVPRRIRFDAHQAARTDVVCVDEIRYEPNAFIGFVNGPQSVHSVSARAATPHVRRYVDFVAELNRPVFRLPQMNPVRRLWFRLCQREQSR